MQLPKMELHCEVPLEGAKVIQNASVTKDRDSLSERKEVSKEDLGLKQGICRVVGKRGPCKRGDLNQQGVCRYHASAGQHVVGPSFEQDFLKSLPNGKRRMTKCVQTTDSDPLVEEYEKKASFEEDFLMSLPQGKRRSATLQTPFEAVEVHARTSEIVEWDSEGLKGCAQKRKRVAETAVGANIKSIETYKKKAPFEESLPNGKRRMTKCVHTPRPTDPNLSYEEKASFEEDFLMSLPQGKRRSATLQTPIVTAELLRLKECKSTPQEHVITAVSKAASDQQVTDQVLANFRNGHLPAGWTVRIGPVNPSCRSNLSRKTWRDGNGKQYRSNFAVENAILSAGGLMLAPHQPEAAEEDRATIPSQTQPDEDSDEADEYDECDENDKKVLEELRKQLKVEKIQRRKAEQSLQEWGAQWSREVCAVVKGECTICYEPEANLQVRRSPYNDHNV